MNNNQIKVVVVEDESPLLKHIHKKIEAVSSDFAVIGDAYNGKEALEIIARTKPDIVFTDIKMPIMDGLELARILFENYPDIHTVVVSGYDDFDYARTVLSYRVCEYLLKPLQPDVLKKVLFSLRASILKKKSSDIYKLLRSALDNESSAGHDNGGCHFPPAAAFSLFLICQNNLCLHSGGTNISYENNLQYFSWDSLLEDAPFTVSDFWLFPHHRDNIYLLVIENLSVSGYDAAAFIHSTLLQQIQNVTINLAVQKNTSCFTQLHTAVNHLHNLLFSSLIVGKSMLITPAGKEMAPPPAVLSLNSLSYFHTMLTGNNSSGFAAALFELFNEWHRNNYPQQWVDKVLTQLLYLLQQELFFSDEDFEQMFQNVFQILEAQTNFILAGEKIAAELLRWITLTSAIPSDIENTIEELDAFIRQHYREDLSLSDLAEKYHFNHSYLTRAFKKQKGEVPLKLINSLRITDAKDLLMNPKLSVREISEMLGFSSQHYFSRCFKNFTGLSPNEYRICQKGTGENELGTGEN